ncbi:MAG: toxin-antitoxin system YwqK family antitoxin [Flavobacteriales bacterium]|nr:toxin-antitoxin system YwqK family antitoxin [Flavobacteriales bacterium]
MRALLLLNLLLVGLMAHAQPPSPANQTDAQGRKQGTWSKTWPNGKVRYTGQFTNDKPTGTFRHYTEDGQLATEQVYAADGRTSRATHYHPNGAVMARGKYVLQEKDSTWNYFSERGHQKSVEHYVKGALTGERLVYYESGQVAERATFKDGVQAGPWKQYFPSGQLKAEANYINGEPEGTMTWYYPSGKKEIEGQVVNGEREGTWLYFNEDGSVQIQVIYERGAFIRERRMNGVFKEYYDDEQVKEEVTYKNGEKHGPFTEYHANGKWAMRTVPPDVERGYPADQERVLQGQTKKREGTYKNGQLEGEVKEYDEKGKLVRKLAFVNGMEQR